MKAWESDKNRLTVLLEDVESVGIKFSRDVSGDFTAADSRVEMI
jgi:hypothetical protein